MKILAIDSSGLVASVAVLEDRKLIAEYSTNFKKTHSQTLLPMLEEIKGMTQLDLATVDAIAVAAGPGSFTGLRIGSATAKGLGLALNKPLIGVPTLEGLAWNAFGVSGLICPMMDARRSQVYTGIYRTEGDGIAVVEDQMAVPVEEILEKLNSYGQPVFLLGDGVEVSLAKIREILTVPYVLAPASMNAQRAGSVAVCAAAYYEQGRMESAADHRPDYLRPSQAEREREERLRAQAAEKA